MQTVRKAISQGLDVNQANVNGLTPLMMAAYNGHLKIGKLLLKQDASVDHKNKQGRTALTLVSSSPFPEMVKILLNHGADPNVTDNLEGWTPLMFAAAEGQTDVINILLAQGADESLKDKDGDTALNFAEKNNHTKAVRRLKRNDK